MNTVMVIMVLLGTTYTAEFEVHYQTEAQCIRQTHNYLVYPKMRSRKAVCVSPDTTVIKELSGDVVRQNLPVVEATGNLVPVPGHVIPD